MGQSATIPRRTTWAAVVMDGTAGAGRMSSAASDSGKADRRTQRWSLDDQPEGLPNRFGGVVVAFRPLRRVFRGERREEDDVDAERKVLGVLVRLAMVSLGYACEPC